MCLQIGKVMKYCIDVNNLKKTFKSHDKSEILIFDNLNFQAKPGEVTVIMGPSGSGKSTLLNILSTIDNTFDEGEVTIMDESIKTLNESAKATFRNRNIGFIFQSHELIAEFTVLENCIIPLQLNGVNKKEAYKEAYQLLEKFNIPKLNYEKFPRELSGGQQQRVGIIRAIINRPAIVFADEPTGNLDSASRDIVIEELQKLTKPSKTHPSGAALCIVTHDSIYESFADAIYKFVLDEANSSSENLSYNFKKVK